MGKAAKKSVYTNSTKKHSSVKNGSTKGDKGNSSGKKNDKEKSFGCCKVFMLVLISAAVAGVAVVYSNDEYRIKGLELLGNVQREVLKQYEENIKPLLNGDQEEKEKQMIEEKRKQEEARETEKLDEEKRIKRELEEKIRKEVERKKKEAEEKRLREEKERLEKEKKQKEEEERKRKEEEKRKQEEEKKKEEEQRRKKEEEVKKKQEEEEKKKRQEEERKRQEAEKKMQEEKKRLEEENRRREEEKKKQEEKRRQEEQKRAEEEKKKRQEELERKRKEEVEKKEKEEENKRLEAEKKRQEEEKQKLAEEKKQKEAKKKQEEDEKKRVEAEKKKQQEDRKKKEEEIKKKTEEANKRQEAEKKKREEELKKKAEEENKRQEAEKKKQEEELKKKKLEEEKKRQEAEKKKQEEELKKKAEEEKKRQEAEKKKQEEELKKKAEEEKKRQEAEKKKQEEELRKKKLEEEKKRQEAEKKKQEEELKKKMLEEEKKKQEAEKKRQEKERKQREEELKKIAEEEKKKVEEQRKKQEEADEKRKKEEKQKQEEIERQKREAERIKKEEARQQQEDKKRKEEEALKYDKMSITNKADFEIKDMLDDAENLLYMTSDQEVLDAFNKILVKYPNSPRANYMKAEILIKMADEQKSNPILEEGITLYQKVLDQKNVPDELLLQAGKTLAEKQLFRGWPPKSMKTWQFLSDRFPDKTDLKNQFGVSLLMMGKNEEAKDVFKQVLAMDPKDGFAKIHYGFILKTHDEDLVGCVKWLTEGIASEAEGTRDGKFYFHLGDAYQRLNQTENAYKIYQAGTENGFFLSTVQRSLYNVPTLTGRPWWTVEETGYQKYFKLLADNWKVIRDEGLAQMDSKMKSFTVESESLKQTGDWKQLTLYQRGMKNKENCAKTPKTCELIDQIPPAKTCKRGQVKFSVIHPGTRLWPHCGPTNCRIRAHLGLKIPQGIKIRVGGDTRTWKEGKFIVFDDSFEHEVWHDGTEPRLVLIVDVWHPELTEEQKRTLTAI